MKIYKKLSVRYSIVCEESNYSTVKFQQSKDVADYARKHLYNGDLEVNESMWAIFLNRALITTGEAKISQGAISGSIMDPIMVARIAVEVLSKAVILVHNHPSGNVKPSESDIAVTQKIRKGLKNLDINIIDHVIVTRNNQYSFADEGML